LKGIEKKDFWNLMRGNRNLAETVWEMLKEGLIRGIPKREFVWRGRTVGQPPSQCFGSGPQTLQRGWVRGKEKVILGHRESERAGMPKSANQEGGTLEM